MAPLGHRPAIVRAATLRRYSATHSGCHSALALPESARPARRHSALVGHRSRARPCAAPLGLRWSWCARPCAAPHGRRSATVHARPLRSAPGPRPSARPIAHASLFVELLGPGHHSRAYSRHHLALAIVQAPFVAPLGPSPGHRSRARSYAAPITRALIRPITWPITRPSLRPPLGPAVVVRPCVEQHDSAIECALSRRHLPPRPLAMSAWVLASGFLAFTPLPSRPLAMSAWVTASGFPAFTPLPSRPPSP